jgi:hypothetical protein
MRDVIKLMSHQDTNKFYAREIVLFNNLIKKLSEVNEKYLNAF